MSNLICKLFFHRLIVLKEFGGSRMCYCLRCKKHFGMHDETHSFIPWDDELTEMYKSFGQL